jgi:hypothetical protein
MAEEFDDLGFVEDSSDDLGFVEDSKSEDKKQYTPMESALKGAEQGAFFDFADEIGGGMAAGMDALQRVLHNQGLAAKSPSQVDAELKEQGFTGDLKPNISDTYTQARDEARQEYEQAQEQNPKAYFGGALAGGAITGKALPLQKLPGITQGKDLKYLTRLKNASIMGAGGGAVAGLGSTKDITDPLGVATDVGIGTATGGVLGPVIETGVVGGEKVWNGGKNLVKKVIGKVSPSNKAAYDVGVANPELSLEDSVQKAVDNFVNITDDAKQYHQNITKDLKTKESSITQEMLSNEAELIKQNAKTLQAEGRIKEANKLVNDFTKKVESLSKENDNLNLKYHEEATKTQQQLQKDLEFQHAEQFKQEQKAYNDAIKQQAEQAKIQEKQFKAQVKQAEEQAANKYNAEKLEIDNQIKDTKLSVKQAENQFKLAQEAMHKNASQDVQNILVESSKNLDSSIASHKENLSKSYNQISSELENKGVSFSGDDLKNKAIELLDNDKILTDVTKQELKNEISKLIPEGTNFNLSQVKQVFQQLRASAKSAENSGNNPLASFIKKVVAEGKEFGYDKIQDKKLLAQLKSTDTDYSNLFKLQDLMDEQLQSIKTLKGMLPNEKGIVPAEATVKAQQLQELLNSNITESGKKLSQDISKNVTDVMGANQEKLATKYNKEMLSKDEQLQKLQSLLEELQTKKQNLKPEEINLTKPDTSFPEIPVPEQKPVPTAPEQAVMSPSKIDLNNQKIAELQSDITDLSNQISGNMDELTQVGMSKQKLSEKTLELKQKLAEFNELKSKMKSQGEAGKMIDVSNEDTLFNSIAKLIRDSEGTSTKNVTAKKYIDELLEKGVISKEQLEQFYKQSDLINTLDKPLEGGSLTDRSLALKILPKISNAAGRIAGKAEQVTSSIKNVATDDITNIIQHLKQFNTPEARIYSEQLSEAANRDVHGRNAAIFGLMQQPKFRKLLNNEEENSNKDK